MDFSKFSDENFDLKKWVNGAFSAQKDTNQNVEQYVSTLITKLQVFIQEINYSIDDTSHQTIQNFPRILREIEVLKQETYMLKEQTRNVREDLIKVEKNTVNDSMKLLLDLDVMRTNFLNAQTSLQEADNWTTLTSDLDSILQTNDTKKISEHIESMQNSLSLIQDDSADYMSRCSLLEDFKNKFETTMSPDIIASFNSKSIESSRKYVLIFGQMNRLDELKKYYYQCEKGKILEKNTQLVSEAMGKNRADGVVFTVEANASPSEALKNLHKNWLDYSIEVWQNESQWCKQIFNDSHAIVINLMKKCFQEFNQGFIVLVDKHVSSNEEIFLEFLSHLKQETDQFVLLIHSSAESSGLLKSSQINDLLFKLFQQVYQPFKTWLKKYSSQLVKYLQFQLDSHIKLNHSDTVECIQLLNGSVTKVFDLIDKVIEQCITLSNACCFSMLIDSLKIFLKSYIDDFKRVVVNLKERKFDSNSAQRSNDGVVEDWDTFRHFVRILQIVGDLIIKYDGLEEILNEKIIDNFTHNLKKLGEASEVDADLLSILNYKEYLLDAEDRAKLNRLISIIESGDDYSIMKDLMKPLYLLSENVHKFAFDVVFAPVKYLIRNFAKSEIWLRKESGKQQSETVPLFAFAPQEYITKIGQYLLTLPQNFEPFIMQDNTNLIVALHKGKLPYLDEKDLSDDITACWLDSIANATAITFSDEILNIQQQISVNSQRQLIIDIEFICSIFEDVGLKDYMTMLGILELLKVNNEEFEVVCKNKPARVVSAIRRMRNF